MENFNRIKRKTFSFHLEIPQIPPSSLTLIFLPLSIFPVLPPSDLPLLPKHLEALLLPLNIPPPTQSATPVEELQSTPHSPFLSLFRSISLTLSLFLSLVLSFISSCFCYSVPPPSENRQIKGSPPLLLEVLSTSLSHLSLWTSFRFHAMFELSFCRLLPKHVYTQIHSITHNRDKPPEE